MHNTDGGLKKEDAALLTVPLITACGCPRFSHVLWQTCVGLLAYPDAASAPPDAQLLLQPSFKHRTASLVNLALIQSTHPSGCAPPLSSSPLTDALAATLALQKLHLDASGGRGLSFQFGVQNEEQLQAQQLRRQELQRQRRERENISLEDASREQLEQQTPLLASWGMGVSAQDCPEFD